MGVTKLLILDVSMQSTKRGKRSAYDIAQTRDNSDQSKLSADCRCTRCRKPLARVKQYVWRQWKTSRMLSPAFEYFHVNCYTAHLSERLTRQAGETSSSTKRG